MYSLEIGSTWSFEKRGVIAVAALCAVARCQENIPRRAGFAMLTDLYEIGNDPCALSLVPFRLVCRLAKLCGSGDF